MHFDREKKKLINYFDKFFFDCLNVGDYTTGKHSLNPFKDPYFSSDDFRYTCPTVITSVYYYPHCLLYNSNT